MRQKQYKNRSVKDCRVGRKNCALLAMTNLTGFAGKRNNFRNETLERRCGATPRKKQPHKTKNVCFPNKTAAISCHCEERSDAAILKFEAWHPAPKHGSTKQEGSPITKKGDSLRCLASSFFILRFCFVPRNHSSFRDGKSFRQRLPRRAQKLRPPRNDKTDRFCGKTKQFPERNV